MPWLQLGSFFANRGIDNPDGAIILVASIISGAVAFYNQTNNKRKLTGLYFAVGVLGLIMVYYDLNEVQDRANQAAKSFGELNDMFGSGGQVSASNFVGAGLYIVGIGSIGLLLTGLGVFNPRPIKEDPQPSSLDGWIRVAPTASPFSNSVETYSEEESEAYKKKLYRINDLISVQQKKITLSDETTELQSVLRSMAKTKVEGIHLINIYKQVFRKDLIEELKKVNNMNGAIAKNVSVFVDLGLIDPQYPHDKIPI